MLSVGLPIGLLDPAHLHVCDDHVLGEYLDGPQRYRVHLLDEGLVQMRMRLLPQ